MICCYHSVMIHFLSFGHETVMYHPLTMVAFNVMFVWHNNRKLFQVPFSHAWWKSFIPTLLLCCIYYNCPLLFYFSSILFDYFCSIVACYAFYSKSENKLHLLVFYLQAHLTEMDKYFNCLFLNKQVNTKYQTLMLIDEC